MDEFKVGRRYGNQRLGAYVVRHIQGDSMIVRLWDGREETLSVDAERRTAFSMEPGLSTMAVRARAVRARPIPSRREHTERTIANALRALPHLTRSAERHQLITYKQLAGAIGCHWRNLSLPLAYIRDEICAPRNLPQVNTLVVHVGDLLPGQRVFSGRILDIAHGDMGKLRAEQARVFAYKNWDEVLKQLGLQPSQP
jgi:hypothetical protein